jgi:hypothetical protein
VGRRQVGIDLMHPGTAALIDNAPFVTPRSRARVDPGILDVAVSVTNPEKPQPLVRQSRAGFV